MECVAKHFGVEFGISNASAHLICPVPIRVPMEPHWAAPKAPAMAPRRPHRIPFLGLQKGPTKGAYIGPVDCL